MSEEYNEYLKFLENPENHFPLERKKLDIKNIKVKILGNNGNYIYFKDSIYLNYGVSDDSTIIYIEDISAGKQFTNDFHNKIIKLHLVNNMLYIDFDTDYYYVLLEFDKFLKIESLLKNQKITISLLNDDKSDIINTLTTNINLL